MKVVAVSACPSGLMHTYMAQESLQKAAKKRGLDIKVETHGAIGIENKLTAEDIKESDVVVFMVDVAMDESRFKGKTIYHFTTSFAVRHAEDILDRIGA